MAIRPIEILIVARDRASAVFAGLETKALGAAAGIAAAFGIEIFKSAVDSAAEFEAQLSDVQAVSGATKDEMVLLRQAAEEAGSSTKFTATEAAEALGNLTRAGLSAKDAIAALPAALSLAQAGSIGLEESSAIMTKTLAGFGLEAANAGRIADVLAMGANASNTSVKGLGEALSYAAPTAQAMGLSLESTVALIGKFADSGIDASRAGTALNSILAQFSDPASKFRGELAALGITTGNFETALGQLAGAGDKGQKAIRAVGLEAGPALQGLINQGMPSLDALRTKLQESAGSSAKFAEVMGNNLTGATNGLSSAWDSLKIALGTPVLPILKDAVNELATSLRSSVSDGTVAKFGEAIAKGFEAALTWARAFLAEVDFAAMAQDLRNAADRAGEAFDSIATYARNAGDIVKTVWGAMSAGSNAVLAVVYSVGEAFAGVASDIQSGLALILEGLAKVTFGDLSASFKAAADDIRLSAEATGAASEALGEKARTAFVGMADGAQLARTGWAGLTGEVQAGERAATASAAAMAEVVKQLQATAETNAAARKATEDKTAADEKARLAVIELRMEVEAYKREYEAALAAGDVQLALEKLGQIQQALRQTGADAKVTGQQIEEAFTRAGIKTKETLAIAATQARGDFETIKNSGQATADGVQSAFKRMADAAIASGDAGAIAFVNSQAAAQGFEVTVDKAGNTIVKKMQEAADATRGAGSAADNAAGSYNRMGQSAEQAAASAKKLAEINARYGRPGEGSTQEGSEKDYDPGRGSIYGRPGEEPTNGNGLTQSEYQRKEKLKGQGAQDLTYQFEMREKLKNGTLTPQDVEGLKALIASQQANQKTFDSISPGLNSLSALADDRQWANVAQGWQDFVNKTEADNKAPAPGQKAGAAPATTYVSNITLPGAGTSSIAFADANSQRQVEALLRQLTQAKGSSA